MKLNYLDHYERVCRMYLDLPSVPEESLLDPSLKTYEDKFYNFFVACYHLKDYLKSCEDIHLSKEVVEDYIQSSTNLKIIADMCNKYKHSKVSRKRSKTRLSFHLKHLRILFKDDNKKEIKIDFRIEGDSGNSYDAYNVARECIKDWNKFLIKNNLISNKSIFLPEKIKIVDLLPIIPTTKQILDNNKSRVKGKWFYWY